MEEETKQEYSSFQQIQNPLFETPIKQDSPAKQFKDFSLDKSTRDKTLSKLQDKLNKPL